MTWAAGNATGYDVVQSTSRSMHKHRKHYTLHGLATQFTPYGLHRGTKYYFRVRSRNGSSTSRYSPVVGARFRARQHSVRVLTYNVLHKMFDGTREDGHKIAPWSKRLPKIAALIRSADPDVMSIEEASDYANRAHTRRTIDTIVRALHHHYRLADADGKAGKPNPRTGNYVLYKRSEYRPIGSSGRWTVSTKNWATYQVLQSRSSAARFLMVSIHLSHGSNSADHKRKLETRRLLADANRRSNGLPIVYAGDFNSFSGRDKSNLDSPQQVLRAHHVDDAYVAAQSRRGVRFGSVNNYSRRPSHSGRVIDHVYGQHGVAMRTWRQILHLRHGHFVGTIPSDHNPVLAGLSVEY